MSPDSVNDINEENIQLHLCPICLRRIAIVLSSSAFNMTNFDYVERYRKLGTCYQKYCCNNNGGNNNNNSNGEKYTTWINERCMAITGQYVLSNNANSTNNIQNDNYDDRPLPVYQEQSSNKTLSNRLPIQRNVQGDENNSTITVHRKMNGFGNEMAQQVDKSKLKFLKRKIKQKSHARDERMKK